VVSGSGDRRADAASVKRIASGSVGKRLPRFTTSEPRRGPALGFHGQRSNRGTFSIQCTREPSRLISISLWSSLLVTVHSGAIEIQVPASGGHGGRAWRP
jgi:hypothetical protein